MNQARVTAAHTHYLQEGMEGRVTLLTVEVKFQEEQFSKRC